MNDDTLPPPAEVRLAPLRAGLCAGRDQQVDVLVRVQAPDAPPAAIEPPPPMALALVIDRSGSMAGRPLDEARRCAAFVADALRPQDHVALVAFDTRVQRLQPALPVGDGVAIKQAIAGIEHGGSTNLHGGWLAGADALAELAGTRLKRVLLMSDGQANAGVVDAAEIAAECARAAARGITTSTCGLGFQFNEALMVAMAQAGGGRAYYGETADDLMGPFHEEMALLGRLCLRRLRLDATASTGCTVAPLAPLLLRSGGWQLPDLAWGAEAWAVLRIEVPAALVPRAGERLAVLRAQIAAQGLDGAGVTLERVALTLPVLAPAAWHALPDDPLVQRRCDELAAAALLARMRAAAQAGAWAEVDTMLSEAVARFAHHDWLAAVLATMRQVAAGRQAHRLGKESAYFETRFVSRLASKDEGRWNQDEPDDIPFLRRPTREGRRDGGPEGQS